MEKKAKYFELRDDGRVKCSLCPVGCALKDGKEGVCLGRYNKGGEMVVTNYGEAVSLSIDPIEKKPLYHFYPGSVILSTGPYGCNLSCSNCQNWHISQNKVSSQYVPPEKMAEIALSEGSIGIAYTYTEPFIWFEYLLDTMPLVREKGGKNVMVTNGYVMPEPLEELIPLIDAMNIDLKSMDEDFYKKVCKGKLENVLHTIKRCHEAGIALELTNLLITGLNDSAEQIGELVDWVASVSPEIPLHFSRYYPTYKMNNPATKPEVLRKAYEIAGKKLTYVYLGNIHIPGTSNTYCPECESLLIERDGFYAATEKLEDGKCANCGRKLNIVNN
ncbi:MAG: AmmeMemoRadiSam system radical SAM enzyme [candidate division Zixibacteria bacterium]|nr:AmmeMemoRadiSam system radical SAM enzyme [candidate division Zixibacteria bacterium]